MKKHFRNIVTPLFLITVFLFLTVYASFSEKTHYRLLTAIPFFLFLCFSTLRMWTYIFNGIFPDEHNRIVDDMFGYIELAKKHKTVPVYITRANIFSGIVTIVTIVIGIVSFYKLQSAYLNHHIKNYGLITEATVFETGYSKRGPESYYFYYDKNGDKHTGDVLGTYPINSIIRVVFSTERPEVHQVVDEE